MDFVVLSEAHLNDDLAPSRQTYSCRSKFPENNYAYLVIALKATIYCSQQPAAFRAVEAHLTLILARH